MLGVALAFTSAMVAMVRSHPSLTSVTYTKSVKPHTVGQAHFLQSHTILMTFLPLPIYPGSAVAPHFSSFPTYFQGLFLFYVYDCVTCMHVNAPATGLVPLEQKRV